MSRKQGSHWPRFRNDILALRKRVIQQFVERSETLSSEDAEGEFYSRCMRFQVALKIQLKEKFPDLDVATYIAWHVLAGSNGITENYAPNMDLPDTFSIKALLLRILEDKEPEFLVPVHAGKARRSKRARRIPSP